MTGLVEILSKEMNILEHIDELRKRLVRILLTIGITSVLCFTFGIKEFTIQNTKVFLPYPDPYINIASQAIARIKHDILPNYVKVLQTEPSQAFTAELYFSVFLGVIIGMPIIIHEVAAFIGPALFPHEKKRILNLILPATILFLLGSIFSYLYITPFTIDFLYQYGFGIVDSYNITIDVLINFVLIFTLAFGLSFELPVIMWLVTAAGIIKPEFWLKNIRYAIVVLVIYGAVVTPDGSGITMWFVAGPMLLLYILGYAVIKRRIKPTNSN